MKFNPENRVISINDLGLVHKVECMNFFRGLWYVKHTNINRKR